MPSSRKNAPTITMHDSFESGGTVEITGTAPSAAAEKRSVTITVYDVKDSENILYMKDNA